MTSGRDLLVGRTGLRTPDRPLTPLPLRSQARYGRSVLKMVESLTLLAIRSPIDPFGRGRAAARSNSRKGAQTPNRGQPGNMHRQAMQAVSDRGKATAILSPDREFIFGDGFHHNLPTVGMAPPRILAPLTPRLAVLYAILNRYTVEPRLSTLVIDAEEADALNQVVQVYYREAIYYRTDKPQLIEEFRAAKHLRYTSSRNIVETIVHDTPGIPDPDTSLDALENMIAGR